MLNTVIYSLLFITVVNGNGEFTVLNSPGGISFKGHERLAEGDLIEVYSAALGFTTERSVSWPGLYITSPFELADAVVEINIDGISSLDNDKGHQFPLKTNADNSDTFYLLSQRITNRYPNAKNKIVDINLSAGLASIKNIDFLNGIKEIKESKETYSYLTPSVKEDREFLQEINFINTITQQIDDGIIVHDSQPDYFNIQCFGLHAVSDLHGENSAATKEAKRILIDSLNHLNEAFKKSYNNRALFTVVSSDASHTRRTRDVPLTETKTDNKATEDDNTLNRAKTYNANYPVIFNIILWFGVIMVFTLLAISMAIGYMDPGRDSIIYRMTSTRMKKDN